jgi:TusA-related sulfurtransferase
MSQAPLPTPDSRLDLQGTPCPINFVRTKLQLDKMAPGTLLEVWIDPGDPVEQVPDSLTMEGYQIEHLAACNDSSSPYFMLYVRRPA